MRPTNLLALLLLTACASCGRAPSKPKGLAEGALRVFVSIPPQAYFVERIGGERVGVEVLVEPGQSPHTFEPTPHQMVRLGQAHVYFTVGLPFEARLMDKLAGSTKTLNVVDMRKGVRLRVLSRAHEHHEHQAQGAPDPHWWLNPRLVKGQAKVICVALKQLDAKHAGQYDENLESFQAALDALDAKMARALAPLKGKEFMVFHPAFGYLGDAYGLKQVPVEIEGKQPTARQLVALIDRAKARGIKVIFVQPQFSRKSAEAIAREIGGAVVPMDPLARDYVKNLADMAEKIRSALIGSGTD